MNHFERILQIEKPERVKGLPTYKGVPIPALTYIDENGNPVFKAIDPEKVASLRDGRKCGICGQALDYWIAFMVTEKEANDRFILESPNHIECLKYAFQVCPWLYYKDAKYIDPSTLKSSGVTFGSAHPDREISNNRPQKLGIYVCRDFKVEVHGRYRGCKVPPPKSLEWIEGV